jgi:hypothetical protein
VASHTLLNAAAEGVVARADLTDSPHVTNEGIGADHLLYLVRLCFIVKKCHMVLFVGISIGLMDWAESITQVGNIRASG